MEAETNSLHSIGYFYSTQMVSTQTKVYVSNIEMGWAQECGRTIYQEFYIPFNIGESDEIEIYDPNIIDPPPVIRYFYYATPSSPIITDKRTLYNDLDSLVFVLQYMETTALQYNLSDPKNEILGFIRSININYIDGEDSNLINEWEIICGDYDNNLRSILNGKYAGGGIKLYEYFSSFMSYEDFNTDLYGSIPFPYFHYNYNFVDPYTGEDCIDLIHMFASLDGIFKGTGETTQNFVVFNYITKDTFRHLVSWGGDLQTATTSVFLEELQNFSFDDVLSGDYQFGYNDYYADIDAVNIATNIDLSSCSNLSSLIADYYDNLCDDVFDRQELFVDKVASTLSSLNLSVSEKFVIAVADMLNLDSNLGPNLPNPLDFAKYKFLFYSQNSLEMVPYGCRLNMAEAFLDYFGVIY